MDDVPAKVYILTVLGIAFLGVLGTVTAAWMSGRVARKVAESTNEHHAEQIDKQLAFERERAEADRRSDHDRWIRLKRHDAYAQHLKMLGIVDRFVAATQTGVDSGIDLDGLYEGADAFDLWATPAVRAENARLREVVAPYVANALRDHALKTSGTKAAMAQARADWTEYRTSLTAIMREDFEKF